MIVYNKIVNCKISLKKDWILDATEFEIKGRKSREKLYKDRLNYKPSDIILGTLAEFATKEFLDTFGDGALTSYPDLEVYETFNKNKMFAPDLMSFSCGKTTKNYHVKSSKYLKNESFVFTINDPLIKGMDDFTNEFFVPVYVDPICGIMDFAIIHGIYNWNMVKNLLKDTYFRAPSKRAIYMKDLKTLG
jgi:hypothetical protein